MNDYIYDIETFPNIFTFRATHAQSGTKYCYEISFRKNETNELCSFLIWLKNNNARMVGYNNIGFDYPIIHFIMKLRCANISVDDIYKKAMSIINASHNERFANMVWESDWLVPQLDLYKIHHFDNMARATSLKVLEFNMRMESIEDLPLPVGTILDSDQANVLLEYNGHDVDATLMFYNKSIDKIKFREELTIKYGRNFVNHNDTKIGKDYFIMELEKVHPQCCYKKINGKKTIQQSPRDEINLGEVILPYIQFHHPEFKRIHNWFKATTIYETKGSIKDINCTIRGFQFDFGTGGIHGSVESQIVESDDTYIIEDLDVASYYPNLAIVNKLSPKHLGETFCVIYKALYNQRKKHAKGTPQNAMLKLALNGTYGDSNNQYSPFYDPKFTMAITVNGQLSLCMLAEVLLTCTELEMIQINTDGLTIRYPRVYKPWVASIARWWETLTGLELESAEYSRMMIRDVNNYIAEYTDGKLKRKGTYEYELEWHQNHSALVVPMAAEAALVHGVDIRKFITSHEDTMDFMLRAKVPRSSYLEWGKERVANIVRYYVSTDGDILEKVMPPAGPVGAYKRANSLADHYFMDIVGEITGFNPQLCENFDWVAVPWDSRIHTKNQSRYEERRSGINTGWTVQLCNNLKDYVPVDINYEWYIKEAEKIVLPLLG